MRDRNTNHAAILIVAAGLPMAAMAQGDPLREPFEAISTIDTLTDGVTGFRFGGRDVGTNVIELIGDINGDGFGDIAVGDVPYSGPGPEKAGVAFVIFGSADGFANPVILDDLDGTDGVRLESFIAFDGLVAPAGAGDVNGDGLDDMVIGAPGRGGYGSGEPGADWHGRAYVVFGRDAASGGFPSVVDLRDLDGSNGFLLEPIASDQVVGRAGFGAIVATVGDLNGDGTNDIGVFARWEDVDGRVDAGRAYIFFGGTDPFPAVVSGSDLDGTNGFRFNGQIENQQMGWFSRSVTDGGDVNGDGVDDVLFGSLRDGVAWALYGRADGVFEADLDTDDIDGADGFVIEGGPGVPLGPIHAIGGDVNGDGVDDLVVSSRSAGSAIPPLLSGGRSFIVFGRTDGFPERLDVSTLDGTDGVRVDGDNGQSGSTVRFAGDVNGDGFGDVLIGAESRGTTRVGGYFDYGRGAAYVVFGRGDGFDPVIDLTNPDGQSAIRFDGNADGIYFGTQVAGGTDINGDGIDDMMFKGYNQINNGYVVFGRAPACPADLDGDGELTLFDFLAFQNLFDAGDPLADFDGDGSLTLFDFLAFQNAFDAGCG
ncbi:MAG: GC-type dockerin domain-anchored protein [Phycisphaerales bacterium]